jgi:hypothetical protein
VGVVTPLLPPPLPVSLLDDRLFISSNAARDSLALSAALPVASIALASLYRFFAFFELAARLLPVSHEKNAATHVITLASTFTNFVSHGNMVSHIG